ncbi:Tryptophan or tyrosine transporter protein [Klebsormidium nitens]|uniref:Tryptophan or tyrosine transporter protein n=1 Tax=Klebsormidium nitens TaxID=105231 RepID=A0A1Y1HLX3_KLENI|nr:Tryptophan or tyrosine transporter protein [Klebsormidium nitens]|eukprot:GAQ78159.1 Tryptophan or tyrosine transporter protein [Klebsormidium nitens]
MLRSGPKKVDPLFEAELQFPSPHNNAENRDTTYSADLPPPASSSDRWLPDSNLFNSSASKNLKSSVAESEKPLASQSPKASGSLLGAVALITGTSVGAGILALPGISAPAGFIPATSIMVGCWGFLVGEALLLAEVNVELLKGVAGDKNRASDVLSLRTMAQKTLGPAGGTAATLAYVFLTYALLTAYIAKSADVLSLLMGLPTEWAGVAFVGFFGVVLLVGGTVFTDYVNQAATGIMLTLFAIMVGGGSLFADWSILENADWAAAPAAVPIIFLSLVYHDLTPVLCSYLGGDIKRIRQAIIGGSLVPLLMFVSCNAVALAISPVTGGGDPLNIIIRLGGPGPAALIECFSLLAISTSFIGTILGATEFALEQLGGLQFAGDRPPLAERKEPTESVNTRKATERRYQGGLGTGLRGSSSNQVKSSKGSGRAGEAAAHEEIDRLQKRVKDKLAQWESRFEREVGNGRKSNLYSVNKLDERSVPRARTSREGIHTRGASSVNNVSLPSSSAIVNSLRLESPSSQTGSSDSENGNGRGLANGTGPAPGPDSSGIKTDDSVGGLWAIEAPTTGKVNWALRTGAFCMVLIPPVGVASQYPDAFFQASNLAGAYGMTTLYGIFPVAMAWSMRSSVKRRGDDSMALGEYSRLVPGGRFTLVLLGLGAAAIMAGQAALDSKLAAGAIADALAEAGPALGALQDAAAVAAAALSDARKHVQSFAADSDALQSVRNALIERYAEVSQALEESTLDESLRNVEMQLRRRLAELTRDVEGFRVAEKLSAAQGGLEKVSMGLGERLSALEDLKLDESLQTAVDSALGLGADLEVEMRQRLAEWTKDLDGSRLAEKLSVAQEGLEKVSMELGKRVSEQLQEFQRLMH